MADSSAPPSADEIQAKMQALLNGPAGVPPLGTVPNFENPANLEYITNPVLVLCLTVATIAVILRTYTRFFLIRSASLEDCTLLPFSCCIKSVL